MEHTVDQATLYAALQSEQIEQSNADAARHGCFGIPWLHADSASFFGQDRS